MGGSPTPTPRASIILASHLSFATNEMPSVITEACITVKDRACVDVCPVDCIYEGEDQLFIHPDECIDCGACEPECPVTAIFPEEDVPAQLRPYIAKNKTVFEGPNPPGRPKK
jgi:ferredoxin